MPTTPYEQQFSYGNAGSPYNPYVSRYWTAWEPHCTPRNDPRDPRCTSSVGYPYYVPPNMLEYERAQVQAHTPATPYAYDPWAPVIPSVRPLVVHRHLSYNPINPNAGPELLWDIVLPPERARVRHPNNAAIWTKPAFDADAVTPSVKKIWLVGQHHNLGYWFSKWGHVKVKSDTKVTVHDVLRTIYTYLRAPLTSDDLDYAMSIPGNRDWLRFAREQRARQSSEVESVVLSSGYRRVDLMGGHRKFAGLALVVQPDNSWMLYFSVLPGPVPRVP